MAKLERAEVKRLVSHAILGTLLVALLYLDFLGSLGSFLPSFLPLPASARAMLLSLILSAVFILISKKHKFPAVHRVLKELGKEEERRAFPLKGSFFYLLGAFVVILLFQRSITLASLIILALGDPTSHLIGSRWGRIRHPFNYNKFIEGHIAGTIMGTMGAISFVPLISAFVAAAVAMFIEGIDIGPLTKVVDDNLIVPLTAGAVLFLIGLI